MSLIHTGEGWKQLGPLSPGMMAARDEVERFADQVVADFSAMSPDMPSIVARSMGRKMGVALLAVFGSLPDVFEGRAT